MRITLTTERGQSVTLDLEPGENAWITTEDQPERTSRSLYLDSWDNLGTGEYNTEHAWWEWASPLNLTPED